MRYRDFRYRYHPKLAQKNAVVNPRSVDNVPLDTHRVKDAEETRVNEPDAPNASNGSATSTNSCEEDVALSHASCICTRYDHGTRSFTSEAVPMNTVTASWDGINRYPRPMQRDWPKSEENAEPHHVVAPEKSNPDDDEVGVKFGFDCVQSTTVAPPNAGDWYVGEFD